MSCLSEELLSGNFNTFMELDLQFFAKQGPGGEKTEEPTSKKLEDSRKEGQVAKSQELGNAVILIGMFIMLRFGCGYMAEGFLSVFNYVYEAIPDLSKMHGGIIPSRDITNFLIYILIRIILLSGPFFIMGVIIGFVVNVMQVKWKPTAKPLKPKFNKFNPVSGVKRIFSQEKLVELLKSILKIVIITYVTYSMLHDKIGIIFAMADMQLSVAVQTIGSLIIDVGFRISLVYLVLAFADYGYQKWKFHEDMKMTKQEVKDEMKNSEGNPEIKGQQKRRMREASQRRMMSAVPQADVVITNPTHFAVALKYDAMIADAPIVVAKGEDFLAQKIKDVARENGVEIYEHQALARMLYNNVPIDGMIPPELYPAVAEILAFVYNIKGKA